MTERSQINLILDTLQQDLPHLFDRDISYAIYSPDIFFQDPVNTFKGKINYRIIFWTLRFHGRLFFTELNFDLHDIALISDDVILANWTVRGTLRVLRARLLFNGYSTYRLRQGLICEHIDTWDRSPGEIVKQIFHPTSRSTRPVDRPNTASLK